MLVYRRSFNAICLFSKTLWWQSLSPTYKVALLNEAFPNCAFIPRTQSALLIPKHISLETVAAMAHIFILGGTKITQH